jgi:hypothetical protein
MLAGRQDRVMIEPVQHKQFRPRDQPVQPLADLRRRVVIVPALDQDRRAADHLRLLGQVFIDRPDEDRPHRASSPRIGAPGFGIKPLPRWSGRGQPLGELERLDAQLQP